MYTHARIKDTNGNDDLAIIHKPKLLLGVLPYRQSAFSRSIKRGFPMLQLHFFSIGTIYLSHRSIEGDVL